MARFHSRRRAIVQVADIAVGGAGLCSGSSGGHCQVAIRGVHAFGSYRHALAFRKLNHAQVTHHPAGLHLVEAFAHKRRPPAAGAVGATAV